MPDLAVGNAINRAAFIMDWINMQCQLCVSDVSRYAHRRL
jgi:hypothetical protein